MAEIRSVFREGIFDGKVALVTGGATGIGYRTVKELISLGCTCVIASRKVHVLTEAAKELNAWANARGAGVTRVYPVECNVRSAESITRCVETTVRLCGKIDFLVNNAGGQFVSPASAIGSKGWHAVIDTNLTGLFFLSQHVYNEVFAKQNSGVIVNVIANMWSGFPGMAHTGAARAAVDNLTKTLANEWGRDGVRVNAVAPGVVKSTGVANYPEVVQQSMLEMGRNNQTFRLGTVEEVSAAIVFLLSPAAAWITGATLRVDGGESIYHPMLPPTSNDNHAVWADGLPPNQDVEGSLAVNPGRNALVPVPSTSQENKDVNAPEAFIDWAKMQSLLSQTNTSGVKCTLLMQLDGALLCVAGDTTIEKIIGALVANIWKSYETGSQSYGATSGPYFMVIDCEDGKLAVAKISRFLLCVYADKSVELGLLKNKITALVERLKPLNSVYPETN